MKRMKRLTILAIWTIALLTIQFFTNCSNPLDTIDDGSNPDDPKIDTTTVYNTDTIFVTDTVALVDTMIVVITDTTGAQFVCARLVSNLQEIVWLFRNHEGRYSFEFAAAIESEHPTQTLMVDIDGEEFRWSPAKEPELLMETNLEKNAIVRISPAKPRSLGHAIHICLTVQAL